MHNRGKARPFPGTVAIIRIIHAAKIDQLFEAAIGMITQGAHGGCIGLRFDDQRELAQPLDGLDERIANASKKAADAMLARLRQGMTMDAVASAAGVSVQTAAEVERNASTVPGPLLAQAFLLPHPAAGKAAFAAVDMHDGSYALVALDKVQVGDLSKVTSEQRESLRQQMAQAYAVEATRELIDILRADSKIKYNKTLM